MEAIANTVFMENFSDGNILKTLWFSIVFAAGKCSNNSRHMTFDRGCQYIESARAWVERTNYDFLSLL